MTRTLCLAQNPDADALLASDMFALLTGMLLDQQIPMEKAFSGPKVLADRMGGLDVRRQPERGAILLPRERRGGCVAHQGDWRFHGRGARSGHRGG